MTMRQPMGMVNYTEVGYKKIKAPDKVFKLIKEFWDRNKDKSKPENWGAGNTYTYVLQSHNFFYFVNVFFFQLDVLCSSIVLFSFFLCYYRNNWVVPSTMVSVEDTSLRGGGYQLKQGEQQATTVDECIGDFNFLPATTRATLSRLCFKFFPINSHLGSSARHDFRLDRTRIDTVLLVRHSRLQGRLYLVAACRSLAPCVECHYQRRARR
jgi:hypothetical protein